MYADDSLLYLGDTRGTLLNVMTLIKDFGDLSGFSINWNKSVLLPIDPIIDPLPQGAEMVHIVSSFRYLGIQISPDPSQYFALNLTQLLSKFREKLNSWCKLPFSVVGRINLIKMVLAPQLIYVFNNSPVWFPRRWFDRIDSQFRELIWRKKIATISLTLQYRKDKGGLAVPQSRACYLASQLQQLGGWGVIDLADATRRLLATWNENMTALAYLEAGFMHLDPEAPTVRMLKTLRAYTKKYTKKMLGI